MLRTLLYRNYPQLGLLVLRIGIGVQFMLHGWPKLAGGAAKWRWLGTQMSNLGIDFMPVFWGFMAAMAEFGGGVLLILGLFHRVAAILMAFTMFVATVMHLAADESAAHSLEMMIVFVALAVMGPGKYSVDRRGR